MNCSLVHWITLGIGFRGALKNLVIYYQIGTIQFEFLDLFHFDQTGPFFCEENKDEMFTKTFNCDEHFQR